MKKSIAFLLPILTRAMLPGFALAMLSACGGTSGNGGSTGNSGGPGVAGTKYTIGGTVTGLTGSGLVLHNGAEELAVSAAGSFIFSTKLATGETYNVSVKSQPSAGGQNCVVANGTGTVGTANVTDITVSCTAQTGSTDYTVGGSVSGLTGRGLVLHNGAEDLAISSAGPFTFTTRYASGTPYAVTVTSQPSAPAQNCVVTNGSGTVGSANVTDVTVSCSTSTGPSRYTIGGAAYGLTGSGLVLFIASKNLAINIGEDLAIPKRSPFSPFTFATEFASGTSYYVGVKSQPSAPAQYCTITNGSGTVGTGNIWSVHVLCEAIPQFPRFAYAANAGDDTIESYSIDPRTGTLSSIGVPVATGTSPYRIVGSPDRKHVYVVNRGSNDISAYAVNSTTGTLTPAPGSPFPAGVDPVALAFSPTGAYLYVANKGSGNLTAYAVDASSGALAPLATPSYATGLSPSDVVADGHGVVYVANQGSNSVSTFLINAHSGGLTNLAGSPFTAGGSPHSLAFAFAIAPGLVTANFDGTTYSISGMSNSPAGSLQLLNTRPLPVANNVSGNAGDFFIAAGDSLDWYSPRDFLDSFNPVLVHSFLGVPGSNVYSATVDPSNKFIYICNDGAANISGYSLDMQTLAPLPGSPFPAGHHPDFIAVL